MTIARACCAFACATARTTRCAMPSSIVPWMGITITPPPSGAAAADCAHADTLPARRQTRAARRRRSTATTTSPARPELRRRELLGDDLAHRVAVGEALELRQHQLHEGTLVAAVGGELG